VRAAITDRAITSVSFQFVRHNDVNETVPCAFAAERAEFDDIAMRSAAYDTQLTPCRNEVVVAL